MNILRFVTRIKFLSKKELSKRYEYIRKYPSPENQKVLAEIDKQIDECNTFYKKSAIFKIKNILHSLILERKVRNWHKLEKGIIEYANSHFSDQNPFSNTPIKEVYQIERFRCEKCHHFVDWKKLPTIWNYNPVHAWNMAEFCKPEDYQDKEWFGPDTSFKACPYCGHAIF